MFGITNNNSTVLANDLRLLGLFLEGGMFIPSSNFKLVIDVVKHNGLISLIELNIHHIMFRNNEYIIVDENLNSLTINMEDIKVLKFI